MSEIKRKKNESFEAYIRRVKKCWQQSGKVLQVKKIQFHQHSISKTMRRKSALHSLRVSAQIEYLQKIGRLPEDNSRSRRR